MGQRKGKEEGVSKSKTAAMLARYANTISSIPDCVCVKNGMKAVVLSIRWDVYL